MQTKQEINKKDTKEILRVSLKNVKQMTNYTDYSVLCKDGENQDAKLEELTMEKLKHCKWKKKFLQ